MGNPEIGTTQRIPGIEQRSVIKHHPHAEQCLVGVVGGSATHAAGVVGGYSANHGRLDGGWIGAYFFAESGQECIGFTACQSWLQPNGCTVCFDDSLFPVVSCDHQQGVCNGLPGKAGAGGPESDGYF